MMTDQRIIILVRFGEKTMNRNIDQESKLLKLSLTMISKEHSRSTNKMNTIVPLMRNHIIHQMKISMVQLIENTRIIHTLQLLVEIEGLIAPRNLFPKCTIRLNTLLNMVEREASTTSEVVQRSSGRMKEKVKVVLAKRVIAGARKRERITRSRGISIVIILVL